MSRRDEEIDVAEELAGERGGFDDGLGTRRRAAGVRLFMFVVLGVAAIIGAVLTFEAWKAHQAKEASSAPKPAIANTLPPLEHDAPATPAATPTTPVAVQQVPALQSPTNEVASNAPKKPSPQEILMQRRLSGGFTGGDTSMTAGEDGAKPIVPAAAVHNAGTLEAQLQPMALQAAKASVLKHRNFLVTRGTMIDCGQQSKLVTDQVGMVTCYTTSDIYSDNGHVVLIDAGSKVTGSYQKGIVQGQSRVFVAWQRLETPQGVVVDLNSPGTDPLGAAGEPGEIDTHFWQRFGGAIMLSIIGDAGEAAIARLQSGNNTTITLGNTSNTTNEMAAEALRNSINIPPTLYKNQGDRVSIFVARDLDFSDVYALK